MKNINRIIRIDPGQLLHTLVNTISTKFIKNDT